jgi:hypothetical protein
MIKVTAHHLGTVARLVMADRLMVALACLRFLEAEVQQIFIIKIAIPQHLHTEVEDNTNISQATVLLRDLRLAGTIPIPLHPASLVVHRLHHLRSRMEDLQEEAGGTHLLTCLLHLVALLVSQELNQTMAGAINRIIVVDLSRHMVGILNHTMVVVHHLRWVSQVHNSPVGLLLVVLPVDTHLITVLRRPLCSRIRTQDFRDNINIMDIMGVVIDSTK